MEVVGNIYENPDLLRCMGACDETGKSREICEVVDDTPDYQEAPRDKRLIYQELERRAALLKKLHESGTTNFYDLYKVLSKAQRQGLF